MRGRGVQQRRRFHARELREWSWQRGIKISRRSSARFHGAKSHRTRERKRETDRGRRWRKMDETWRVKRKWREGEEKICGAKVPEGVAIEGGTLYLLCRRLFVYIPRTGNGDGPFDVSPLAKMLRDKRGKTLGRPPLVSRLARNHRLGTVLAAIENAMKRTSCRPYALVSAISLCRWIMKPSRSVGGISSFLRFTERTYRFFGSFLEASRNRRGSFL